MPVSFPSAVNAPGAASYSAPLLDFGAFGQWGQAYEQGVLSKQQEQENKQRQQLNQQKIAEGQRQDELAKTFQGGLPRDAAGGIDYSKVAAMLAQKGDIASLSQLAPLISQQQAGNTPLLPQQGGQGGGGPSSVAAPPLPAPAANSPRGDSGQGTITSLVTDRLPSQNQTTGATIIKIAEVMGLDPNADLTPGQQRRAQGLLAKYAPEVAGPASGQGAPLPPSANAVSAAPRVQTADASSRLPQPQPQVPQQPPQAAPTQPSPAPIGAGSGGQVGAGAPQPPQAAPQQQGGPIVPQVPLPIDPKTNRPFTDPMEAINFLRDRAAKLEAANPKAKPIAERLNGMAAQIEASIMPVKLGQYDTYVNPANPNKIVAQGASAALISGAAGRSETVESDAEVYRQTGKMPAGIARTPQGQAEAHAIRALAREQEIAQGGDPNEWPGRWQSFATQAAGKRALETRAAGLSLAENEATSLIPRVREISSKIKRTEYPTINSLMLAAQKGTGGTDVIKLGIAIESLVPVYARVLKPVGQVGQGDMARAHDILDKAWSDGQIGAALDQMEVELKSARSALDKTMRESENRGKAKKETDTSSSSSSKSDAEGWTTLPNGARIREVK